MTVSEMTRKMLSVPGGRYVTGCRVSVVFGASPVYSGRNRSRPKGCHGPDIGWQNIGLELAILGSDDELKWA
jgi:hypothetical protein